MASEAVIKASIESKISFLHTYSSWTIGVTDDPQRRRREHGNPTSWSHWDADTEAIARSVEAYFIDKGMKGGTGCPGSADYVYVF